MAPIIEIWWQPACLLGINQPWNVEKGESEGIIDPCEPTQVPSTLPTLWTTWTLSGTDHPLVLGVLGPLVYLGCTAVMTSLRSGFWAPLAISTF